MRKTKQDEILIALAKHGELTQYDLAQKLRVAAESTVWKTIRKLEKEQLIELKRKEKWEKIKEKPKKYYGLTFRGLVKAIKSNKIRLHQIKNVDIMLNQWIEKTFKIMIQLEKLKLSKKQIESMLKNVKNKFSKALKENPEDLELYLKHFDLKFSEDFLIFTETVAFITGVMPSIQTINLFQEQKIQKLIEQIEKEFTGKLRFAYETYQKKNGGS